MTIASSPLHSATIANLDRIGDAWISKANLGHLVGCTSEALIDPLGDLLDEGEVESKATEGPTLYRKLRDRTGGARRAVGLPIWNPWRHISRFSGELIVGRVCLDFYFGKPALRIRGLRAPQERLRSRGGNFRCSYFLASGSTMIHVRRWR